MALTADQLNTIYNNVLFRNVDTGGIQYFANRSDISDAQVRQQIELSSEASTFVSPVIRLYQEVLGRVPDAAGLKFFSNQLRAGTSLDNVAQQLVNSSEFQAKTTATSGSVDVTDITNTNQLVSDAFQSILGRTPASSEFQYFQGKSAAQILSAVAGSAEATQTNVSGVVTYLDSVAQGTTPTGSLNSQSGGTGGTNAGQTFALTTGVDTLTGTAGNDTFVADNTTTTVTSAADSVNGGAGTDTLKVFLASSATSLTLPTLNSVEVLNINGGSLTALNASTLSGVTSVVFDSSTETAAAGLARTVTVANQSVTLANLQPAVANQTSGAATAGGGATFTTTIASTNDTAESVTLSGVKNGTYTDTTALAATINQTATNVLDIAGTKVAALTLTSTGSANTIGLTNTGAALTGLTVAGDQSITLNAAASVANLKTLVVTDTAGSNITLAAAQAANFSYTGGNGNDTLDISAGVTSAAALNLLTINGGAGTDTLVVNNAIATGTTAITSLTSVEILGVQNANGTVNFANFSGETGIKLFGTDGGAVTINSLPSVATLDLGTSADGGNALNVNAIGSGTTDTLGITLGSSSAALGTHAGVTTITGYETITLTSQGAANTLGGNTVFAASAGGSETVNLNLTTAFTEGGTLTLSGTSTALNVSGSGALTLTGVLTAGSFTDTGTGAITASAANNVLNVDASSNTAAVTFNDSGATSGALLKFGNGGITVTGSGFNDVITVGSGVNTVTGGNGADSITVNHAGITTNATTFAYTATGQTGAGIAANGTLTGVDVITGAQQGDKIDLHTLSTTYTTIVNENAFTGAEATAGTAVGANVTFVRGDFNASTNAFTASANGASTLVEYDNNGTTASGSVEAIVLVGFTNASAHATVAAGVITL